MKHRICMLNIARINYDHRLDISCIKGEDVYKRQGKHMGYISLYKRPAFFFVDVKYHVHISTSFSWLLVFMLIVRYLAYTCKQETCRVLQML